MIPRSFSSVWTLLIISLIGSIQISYGSPQFSIDANEFTEGAQISSQSPTQQLERRQFDESDRQRYSPDLPPFRFSGGHDDDDRGSGPNDRNNIGFASSPPQGFPSFGDIESDFAKFGGPSSSPSDEESQYYSSRPPPRRPHPSSHSQGPPRHYPSDDTREDVYEGSPPPQRQYSHAPNSIASGPYGQGRPDYSGQGPSYRPNSGAYDVEDAPYEGRPQQYAPNRPSYRPQNSRPNNYQHAVEHSDPKRPIILKVSGLKDNNYHSNDQPGPSVFYAPSPDVQTKKRKNQNRQRQRHQHDPLYHHQEQNDYQGHDGGLEEHPGGSPYDERPQRGSPPPRYRRDTEQLEPLVNGTNTTTEIPVSTPLTTKESTSKKEIVSKIKPSSSASKKLTRSGKKEEVDPMLADGSEQDNFWDLTSPFIMFDTYKKHSGVDEDEAASTQEETDHSSHHLPLPLTSSSGNVSFHDSNSEEQRFFPSFPSPYLGLSPFGSGGAPARAPLFPGPSANRAPSRYHPSTFGGHKYSTAALPNRGPSSVAASHDRYQDNNLLGSGNFEVVRGGTYYGEDDEGPSYHHGGGGNSGGSPAYHDDDDGYFHHNGHSSPYRGGGGDFFANFRDFADINPHSRSFSHNHETHHIAASELSSQKKQPNNIFDKLKLSSGDSQPQFSMEYDPMMATF